MKNIKDIAEEALGKMKLPKGATTITIDIIGKGKPDSDEAKTLAKMFGEPFGIEKEEEGDDLVASIRGVIKTLEDILAKCEQKKEPKEAEEEIETEEPEED